MRRSLSRLARSIPLLLTLALGALLLAPAGPAAFPSADRAAPAPDLFDTIHAELAQAPLAAIPAFAILAVAEHEAHETASALAAAVDPGPDPDISATGARAVHAPPLITEPIEPAAYRSGAQRAIPAAAPIATARSGTLEYPTA